MSIDRCMKFNRTSSNDVPMTQPSFDVTTPGFGIRPASTASHTGPRWAEIYAVRGEQQILSELQGADRLSAADRKRFFRNSYNGQALPECASDNNRSPNELFTERSRCKCDTLFDALAGKGWQ